MYHITILTNHCRYFTTDERDSVNLNQREVCQTESRYRKRLSSYFESQMRLSTYSRLQFNHTVDVSSRFNMVDFQV